MLSFLSKQRKPGWMAVVSGAEGVTLAHVLRPRGLKPRLSRLETFAVERDVSDALTRLRASGLAGYACTTLLSSGDYVVSSLDDPGVPREERREALRWALKDAVPFAVDTACVDVLDVPAGSLGPGRAPGVLAVIADEGAVRRRAAPFEAAKLDLAAIDIPELAQRNVAALLEDENRGLVLLRIDAEGVMLTLTWRGELVAVRRRDDRDIQAVNHGHFPDAETAGERLSLELQRSLDNFDRQYGQIAVSRVVLSMPADSERLLDALRAGSDLPVEPLDLASVLDLSAVPALRDPREQARHLLAIGAALRDEVAV
mgnify:FL=1